MRFPYLGEQYLIEFERERRVPHGSVYGVPRTYTTARIIKVTGPERDNREVVREYTVGYNPSDRFSYESGRKYALTLAMKDAPIEKSCGSGVPLMGKHLNKKFRTAVWNAYHNRFNS